MTKTNAAENLEIEADMIDVMACILRDALAPIATLAPSITDADLAAVLEMILNDCEKHGISNAGGDAHKKASERISDYIKRVNAQA